jgi:hypothetical protein
MGEINWEEVKTKIFSWEAEKDFIVIHWEVQYYKNSNIFASTPIAKKDELDVEVYLRESFKSVKPFIKEWLSSVVQQNPNGIKDTEVQWSASDWMDVDEAK